MENIDTLGDVATETLQVKSPEKRVLEESFYTGSITDIAGWLKENVDKIGQRQEKSGNKIPFNSEERTELFRGLMRGWITERISSFTTLEEATTVYNTYDPEGLKIRDFYDWVDERTKKEGYKGKGPVLKSVTQKSLEDTDFSKRTGTSTSEVALGYAGGPGALYYDASVIPDGALLDEGGKIVGLVETKAYTKEEFNAWLDALNAKTGKVKGFQATIRDPKFGKMDMLLGADFTKEQEFIDIFKANVEGKRTDPKGPVILLRLPADIENYRLEELGEKMRYYGYLRVIIQKLEWGVEDLNGFVRYALSKENVREAFKGLKTQFSNKDKLVLEKLGL